MKCIDWLGNDVRVKMLHSAREVNLYSAADQIYRSEMKTGRWMWSHLSGEQRTELLFPPIAILCFQQRQ